MNRLVRATLPVTASALALVGLMAFKSARHLPDEQVNAFHAEVRQAVADMPMEIGLWTGRETEVPPAAAALLEPVALRAISYENVATGRTAALAVIHCGDARDMQGHYPPNCYPSSGWQLRGAKQVDQQVGDLSLPSTGYVFSRETLEQYRQMHITNFFLLPSGEIVRDMAGVEQHLGDRLMREMGAAQIQLITEFRLSPSERQNVFDALVGANLPLLNALLRNETVQGNKHARSRS